ncbi:hypothetical protein D3C81_1741350 [compost metagenome]
MTVVALAALNTADNRPLHGLSGANQQYDAVQQLRQLQHYILFTQPYFLMQIADLGNR